MSLIVFLFLNPLREAMFGASYLDFVDQPTALEPFQEQENGLRVEPVDDVGEIGVDVVLAEVGECGSGLVQPVQELDRAADPMAAILRGAVRVSASCRLTTSPADDVPFGIGPDEILLV
ncbi:hypothetical protein ABZ511_06195 [Nocardia gamkensis]|uniref:hypothetical protein n=1 Tax=Nocardia gamkensis TaxID=352869 RepID=UPI0033E1F06D